MNNRTSNLKQHQYLSHLKPYQQQKNQNQNGFEQFIQQRHSASQYLFKNINPINNKKQKIISSSRIPNTAQTNINNHNRQYKYDHQQQIINENSNKVQNIQYNININNKNNKNLNLKYSAYHQKYKYNHYNNYNNYNFSGNVSRQKNKRQRQRQRQRQNNTKDNYFQKSSSNYDLNNKNNSQLKIQNFVEGYDTILNQNIYSNRKSLLLNSNQYENKFLGNNNYNYNKSNSYQNFQKSHQNNQIHQNYQNYQNYQNSQYNNNFKPFKINQNIPLYKDKHKLQSFYRLKSEDLWMIIKPIPYQLDQKILTPYQKHVFYIKQQHLKSINQEQDYQYKKLGINLGNNQISNLQNKKNSENKYKFKHSLKLNQQQKAIINAWLISMYEQITSDNYRKLNFFGNVKNCKVFESKNILFNISFFIQKLSQVFIQQGDKGKYRNTKKQFQVLKFITQQSKQIISTQKIKYPQSEASGGNAQLKAIITKTDKAKDLLQCDLLFNFLDKQKKPVVCFNNYKGDLTFSTCVSQIMKVINHISGITALPFDQSNINYTNYDAFKQLMNKLFTQHAELSIRVNQIRFLFKSNQIRKIQSIDVEKFRKILEITGNGQSQTDYKIGMKLSQQIKKFSQEQIQKANFEIKDGAILRIMTKWAEQLKNKIKQKEHFLTSGNLLKKTNGGILMTMLQDQQMKSKIRMQIDKIQSEIQIKFEEIHSNFLKIQSQILNLKYLSQTLNSLDTNIGILASETQMCIGNYLLNQLFHLIKGLEKIAIELQKVFHGKLDLVTFNIGDLMRCKCKGNIESIKSIYQTLKYMSENIPEILQIVRLKDRLDKPDNDILINILFMGKIQCEIQLSLQSHSNQMNALKNQFNHFLYELHRAQFGVLSQCCCIITKNDPVSKILAFPHKHLIAQDYKKIIQRQNIHEKKQKFEPFFCFQCNSLVKNSNPNFFKQNLHSFVCNKCFEKNEKWDEIQKKIFSSSHLKNQENEILVKNLKKVQKIKQIRDIPQKGILISKSNQIPQYEYFQLQNYPKTTSNFYLISKSIINKKPQKRLFDITQNGSKKIIKNLLNEYYIFEPINGFNLVQKENSIFFTNQQQKPEQQIKLCEKIQIKKIIIQINIENIKDIVNKQRTTLKFQNMQFLKQTFEKIKGLMSFQLIRRIHLNDFQDKMNQEIMVTILQTLGTFYIRKIFLQNSHIQNIPSFKLDFRYLLELNVSFTFLTKLQIQCPSLQFLYCSHSKLKQLDMLFFPHLKTLDCSQNQIQSLKNMMYLNNIHYIDCSNNKIQSIQFNFIKPAIQRDNFPLKNLICTNNKIKSIQFPYDVLAQNLQILNCSNNNFQETKHIQRIILSHFESLKILNLSSCYIKCQKLHINQKSFPKLKIIDISKNKDIQQLFISNDNSQQQQLHQNSSFLQFINASNCKFKKVSIHNLRNLIQVNLSLSQIKQIQIVNAPKLKKIKCIEMQNQVSELILKNVPSLEKILAHQSNIIKKTYENLNLNQNIKDIDQIIFDEKKIMNKSLMINNQNRQMNLRPNSIMEDQQNIQNSKLYQSTNRSKFLTKDSNQDQNQYQYQYQNQIRNQHYNDYQASRPVKPATYHQSFNALEGNLNTQYNVDSNIQYVPVETIKDGVIVVDYVPVQRHANNNAHQMHGGTSYASTGYTSSSYTVSSYVSPPSTNYQFSALNNHQIQNYNMTKKNNPQNSQVIASNYQPQNINQYQQPQTSAKLYQPIHHHQSQNNLQISPGTQYYYTSMIPKNRFLYPVTYSSGIKQQIQQDYNSTIRQTILSKQIQNRRINNNNNKYFSQKQFFNFINCFIKFHLKIQTSGSAQENFKIYHTFEQTNLMKPLYLDQMNYNSQYQYVVQLKIENNPNFQIYCNLMSVVYQKKKALLAPQQLCYIQQCKNNIKVSNGNQLQQRQSIDINTRNQLLLKSYPKNLNILKAEYYQTGLFLLLIGTLGQQQKIYNINGNQWKINYQYIKQLIQILRLNYHPKLTSIIQNMLEQNPDKRKDFCEVYQLMHNYVDYQTFLRFVKIQNKQKQIIMKSRIMSQKSNEFSQNFKESVE